MKTIEAVSHFGSKSRLAKALKITKSSVTQWGDEVPELRKYQIKEIIGKQSKRPEKAA